MFFTKKVSTSELVRSTFVPVVLGLAAGMAGAIVVGSYFAALSVATNEPLQIGRLPSVSNAPLLQTDLAERLDRFNAPLYARRAAGSEPAQRAFSPAEAAGFAAVLTSDGWLATAPSAVSAPVQVALGGRLLEPKMQITDPRTGIVFLKVDATALPVSGFEETEALRIGAPLYALDEAGLFHPSTYAGTTPLNRKAQAPALQNSDQFMRAFRLDRSWGAGAAGGAVLSGDGDLAGILVPDKTGSDQFVPMHLIQPILAQIFRGEAPARAQLGASFLPLGETAFAEGGFAGIKGLRVTGSRTLGISAVRAGSSAAAAGLQEGDLLMRADGIDLSGDRNLSELVAEWEPGETIRFDFVRDGAERSADVTLGGEKR